MPDHTKAQVLEQVNQTPFFVFFNHGDPEVCQKVITACHDGGVRIFEFTNRQKNAPGVFSELHPWVRNEFPDMVFGAGTIYDAEDADLYINMGADFIVSPAVDEEVAEICNRKRSHGSPVACPLQKFTVLRRWGQLSLKYFPL